MDPLLSSLELVLQVAFSFFEDVSVQLENLMLSLSVSIECVRVYVSGLVQQSSMFRGTNVS